MATLIGSSLIKNVGTPYFGGRYQVSGIVSLSGVPGQYRVVLFDRRSSRPVRDTVSDEEGHYVFAYLPEGDYFAVGYNHTNEPLADAINNRLTLERMP